MLYYERKFFKKGFEFVIGVDEVGRGPLAGPVVASAVLLKKKRFTNPIIDSKKLRPKQREEAFFELIDKSIFDIGIVNEEVIDKINILQASRLAMKEAVQKLVRRLARQENRLNDFRDKICVLVDGNIKLDIAYPYINIIQGDNRSRSIAAASILAKYIRDKIMSAQDRFYPQYGFLKHKGYPTPRHKLSLKKYGPSSIHRGSFLRKISV